MREAVAGPNNPAYTHGHTEGGVFSPTYHSWASMRTRCFNPKAERYDRYGGRGITVCPRWDSFAHFLSDMGERPEGKTLDRKDNDGPYCPDNCRWADDYTQVSNRCNTIRVVIYGAEKPLTTWAKELGISLNTVRARVKKQGMNYAEALTKPTKTADGKRASGFAVTAQPKRRDHE